MEGEFYEGQDTQEEILRNKPLLAAYDGFAMFKFVDKGTSI